MAGKVTKESAHYVARSRKPTQHCADCSMYRDPNKCTKVEGHIDPQGWCQHYWRKR